MIQEDAIAKYVFIIAISFLSPTATAELKEGFFVKKNFKIKNLLN